MRMNDFSNSKAIKENFSIMNSLWETLPCEGFTEDIILFQIIKEFKPFFMREMCTFTNLEFSTALLENYKKIIKEINDMSV